MAGISEHRREEPSPSMSRSAEDNLSNSDGPLIGGKKNVQSGSLMNSPAMLLQQDKCYKSYSDHYSSDEKKNHRCIWMITFILTFIGFCNLLLNLTILIVLRVSQGMESLEIIPDEDMIKFYGNTDLDRVCLQRGICEGFGDQPIELIGDAGGVHIQVANRQSTTWSNLQVLKNGTSVSHVESFLVKDPYSGSPIFSTESPNFGFHQIRRMEVNVTQTHRIVAPKKDNLSITSNESILMHGAEGATLDSKDIIWTAKNDITLNSTNGNIVIEAKDSINMPKIPITQFFIHSQSKEVQKQYKVCVCMPEGKLFLVPAHVENVKVNCAKYSRSMETDPCAS